MQKFISMRRIVNYQIVLGNYLFSPLTIHHSQSHNLVNRKEFASEGSRWHDLVRSGTIETVIPAWIAAEDVQKQMQAFQKNYIIYPIPQAELDAMPGLYTQNPGY